MRCPTGFPFSRSRVVLLGMASTWAFIGTSVEGQTVADVLRGWRAREQQCRSLRCEWEARVAIRAVPGLVFPPETAEVESQDKKGIAGLRTGTQRWTFLLDGRRVRTESSGLKWDAIGDTFDNWTTTYIFDEATNVRHQNFMSTKSPVPGSSTATFVKSRSFRDKYDFFTSPVLVNCRPLDAVLSHIDPDKLEMGATAPTLIDGVECWTVVLKDLGGSTWTYWVAPQRGFGVVRVAFANSDGKVLSQDDIVLARAEKPSSWTPLSWKQIRYRVRADGGVVVAQAVDATVKRLEVNVDLDNDVFQFTFPEDTYVHATDGENRMAYLVKKGARRRS